MITVLPALRVPGELDKPTRRRLRRMPCILCGVALAGSRAVASTTSPVALEGDPHVQLPAWVAHHGCYLEAFRRALRSVPMLVSAPSEGHAHEAFRAVLTNRAIAALHL